MTRNMVFFLIVVSIGLMLSSGCAPSQATRFYLLSPMATEERPLGLRETTFESSLGLGPIDLPAYLDRPQIVTRTTRQALDVAEFHQWAEPLQQTVESVLTENLSFLLGTDDILRYPWKRRNAADYQLVMDIIEFDRNQGGDAVMLARWSVLNRDGKNILLTKKSRYTEVPHGTDYQSLVEALSVTVEAVSREISGEILSLSRGQQVRE